MVRKFKITLTVRDPLRRAQWSERQLTFIISDRIIQEMGLGTAIREVAFPKLEGWRHYYAQIGVQLEATGLFEEKVNAQGEPYWHRFVIPVEPTGMVCSAEPPHGDRGGSGPAELAMRCSTCECPQSRHVAGVGSCGCGSCGGYAISILPSPAHQWNAVEIAVAAEVIWKHGQDASSREFNRGIQALLHELGRTAQARHEETA